MTRYIEQRNKNAAKKELSDLAIFGQIGGIIFLFVGYIRYITSYKVIPFVSYMFMALGLYLLVVGIICPQSIRWFYKGFSFVGDRIGQCIFCVLLTIVYILLIIPIGMIMKRKKADYLYISWDDECENSKTNWGFTDWQGLLYKKNRGIMGIFVNTIGVFAGNGHAFLVPVVVLLVAIGIVLFFVSSSVMAPFIYTLF